MEEALNLVMVLSSVFLAWSLALLLVIRKKYRGTVYRRLLNLFSLLVGFYIVYFNVHHYVVWFSNIIEMLVSFFFMVMCFEIWKVFK